MLNTEFEPEILFSPLDACTVFSICLGASPNAYRHLQALRKCSEESDRYNMALRSFFRDRAHAERGLSTTSIGNAVAALKLHRPDCPQRIEDVIAQLPKQHKATDDQQPSTAAMIQQKRRTPQPSPRSIKQHVGMPIQTHRHSGASSNPEKHLRLKQTVEHPQQQVRTPATFYPSYQMLS
eukprot:GHVT01014797.1.p1 GENE.GHVT01014797.1~~GHVT01014797.1.p1  ORF type:complete len:180 (-),score=21.23 GHVT01014797.1:710-1249(-)